MKHADQRTFLAAIDLDGTLFGPSGSAGNANRAALARLAENGFHLALASGRHPRNMVNIAADLPLIEWIVSCQGAEAADAPRARIFRQEFMPAPVAHDLIEAGMAEGFGVLVYMASGEFTPHYCHGIDLYRAISHTEVGLFTPDQLAAEEVFKVMWITDADRMDTFLAGGGRERYRQPGLESIRSHACVFEFVPTGISKATGVEVIAEELGIPSTQVAAFGDAENDLALFRWAGFSVAMPEATAELQQVATIVAPTGPPESAFARGVDALLAMLAATPSP